MTTWFSNLHPALRSSWHPVAAAAEVGTEQPVGVTLLGERWVVTRLGGQLVALADRCPHRLAPLSAGRVVDDTLECAYHGWRFSAEGACVRVPALGESGPISSRAACQPVAAVAERFGLVWLSLDPPITPLPVVPEWDDPAFTVVPLPPMDWNASAAQMADNFLDVAHFPFTHRNTFGDPDDQEVAPYPLEREGWTFRTDHFHSTKALADSVNAPTSFEVHERRMRFTCTAPHHVYLRIDYPVEDVTLTILFFHQPVDAETTRLWAFNIRNDIADGRCTPSQTINFQLAVAREDQALLEQFPVKAVPLDPGVESHTRADKITVELRRMLADLVDAAT
jgi:vanillate O-demethylase monooxygenase subunit